MELRKGGRFGNRINRHFFSEMTVDVVYRPTNPTIILGSIVEFLLGFKHQQRTSLYWRFIKNFPLMVHFTRRNSPKKKS